MTEQKARVEFIDGSIRLVPVKNVHWVGEEGARQATAIVDGREVPIYKRSEPEWGPLWYEQEKPGLTGGTCVECERLCAILNDQGECEACHIQALMDRGLV